MNNLYDALEICLQDLESGTDLETSLLRYPDLADELRPLLQISVSAKEMAVPEPSADVVRRNRAKLLQHAAQMREARPAYNWFPTLQRLAVALVLLVLFFVSGTSLVRASAAALPGDGLYSVKRVAERVSLFFTFNARAHEALATAYENERLAEINDLFASGRSAVVEFSGVITNQTSVDLRVANVLVRFASQTQLPNQPLTLGMAVHVVGMTDLAGVVVAERIEVLPSDAPLPEVDEIKSEIEVQTPQATSTPVNAGTDSGLVIDATVTPVPTLQSESFVGVLNIMSEDIWTVNAILVNIANAEIVGVPVVGASALVEGYYGLDGVFVAARIEFVNGANNENVNSNGNAGGEVVTNGNDNANDNVDGNSNGSDDNTANDNGGNDNDNSGSGGNDNGDSNDDNSGGGGGGDDNSGGDNDNDNGG